MYKELRHMLTKELDEITDKGELSAGVLETVDKLTHAIKSIDTIVAMEESGYSHGYRHHRYDPEYEGRSYARRDSMGRYSRTEAEDDLMHDLREYIKTAPEEGKHAARTLLNHLKTT